MKKTAKLIFTLILIGAVGFVMCGILMDWFTTSDTVIPPTCTEQGYTLHRGWFGTESQINITAPLGHSYGKSYTQATCTAGGFSTYTCTECGHSYTDDPTKPIGHAYIKTTLNATCTAGGYSTYVCFACGDTYTGEFKYNLMDGFGTYFFTSGRVFVGEFVAGEPKA